MLVTRSVFQAKYGKGSELVELFKEARNTWSEMSGTRILTDASGSFFSVVTEDEVENFTAWEKRISETFAHPDFGEWFARMEPLVESGSREFYYLE